MKHNIIKIVLYVLIIIFIFLLLRNNKSLEGYNLTDLTVGKWKFSGDSSTLSLSSSESDKTIAFGAPLDVLGLIISKATKNQGNIKIDDNVLSLKNDLYIGPITGEGGIRITKNGDLFIHPRTGDKASYIHFKNMYNENGWYIGDGAGGGSFVIATEKGNGGTTWGVNK